MESTFLGELASTLSAEIRQDAGELMDALSSPANFDDDDDDYENDEDIVNAIKVKTEPETGVESEEPEPEVADSDETITEPEMESFDDRQPDTSADQSEFYTEPQNDSPQPRNDSLKLRHAESDSGIDPEEPEMEPEPEFESISDDESLGDDETLDDSRRHSRSSSIDNNGTNTDHVEDRLQMCKYAVDLLKDYPDERLSKIPGIAREKIWKMAKEDGLFSNRTPDTLAHAFQRTVLRDLSEYVSNEEDRQLIFANLSKLGLTLRKNRFGDLKKPFSQEELKKMCQFLISVIRRNKTNELPRQSFYKIWTLAHEKGLFRCRTTPELSKKFREKILPRLSKYFPSAEDRELIKENVSKFGSGSTWITTYNQGKAIFEFVIQMLRAWPSEERMRQLDGRSTLEKLWNLSREQGLHLKDSGRAFDSALRRGLPHLNELVSSEEDRLLLLSSLNKLGIGTGGFLKRKREKAEQNSSSFENDLKAEIADTCVEVSVGVVTEDWNKGDHDSTQMNHNDCIASAALVQTCGTPTSRTAEPSSSSQSRSRINRSPPQNDDHVTLLALKCRQQENEIFKLKRHMDDLYNQLNYYQQECMRQQHTNRLLISKNIELENHIMALEYEVNQALTSNGTLNNGSDVTSEETSAVALVDSTAPPSGETCSVIRTAPSSDQPSFTMEDCLNYWGELRTSKQMKIKRFMLRPGCSYSFRNMSSSKMCPAVFGRFSYAAVNAFASKLEEYGLVHIEKKTFMQSGWIVHKMHYKDMSEEGKLFMAELNVDIQQYEDTFNTLKW